jgi:hypothetical protein
MGLQYFIPQQFVGRLIQQKLCPLKSTVCQPLFSPSLLSLGFLPANACEIDVAMAT